MRPECPSPTDEASTKFRQSQREMEEDEGETFPDRKEGGLFPEGHMLLVR